MKTLSIDIETYSDVPLQKTGVYRYVESPDFEILLFAYSIDSQPVQVIDLACGEQIPKEILLALEDECVIKWAFNATFERICLSRFLGYPTGKYLKPESWRYSMIWSATMDFHSPWKVSRIKKRFDVREIKSSKDITDWNAGKIPVEVIHPASAGHGLKLQAGGSTLIWFGLTWSLELYQQTNARLWRQGQASGTVVIEHIITKRKYKSTTIVFLDTRKTRTATSSSIQNRQKS